MSILVYVDGVLQGRKNALNKDGMLLYKSFKQFTRTVLIGEKFSLVDHFCRQNKFGVVDEIVDYTTVPPGDDIEFRIAMAQRAKGQIDYVVTPKPDLAKKLIEHGFRTLLFLDPIYLDHVARPDSRQGIKVWAELEAEIDRQQELLLEDPRI